MGFESSYIISQGLFLKLLAFSYLCAFFSLAVQVEGLFGSKGIAPIKNNLKFLQIHYKKKSFRNTPTIFWYNSSDRFIKYAAWFGVAFSALCMLGIYPAILLTLLWMLYFSFYNIGSPFLNYQWDVLLLEVGVLGILYAIQSPPPLLATYLLWFFLFRFIFSSGYTKLVWGSREWKDLTAMNYHYETQPLPTKLAYYAHQQPLWFSKASVIGVYFFEIVVPLLIFTPDTIRVIACILLIILQLLIAATGNYAFFNLLSIILCIPLLPDSYLAGFAGLAYFNPLFGENTFVAVAISVVAGGLFFLNILEFLSLFIPMRRLRGFLNISHRFCCAAPYGLFVRMTTYRDEIVIEGSNDKKEWKEYEFKWKPGPLEQGPKLVAPHQPRLDWQLWFASLTDYHRIPWFEVFLHRILEGSEPVLALMKHNPFGKNPPKYIRARRLRYHFTDPASKRKTGKWWTKTNLGPYSPIVSLPEER